MQNLDKIVCRALRSAFAHHSARHSGFMPESTRALPLPVILPVILALCQNPPGGASRRTHYTSQDGAAVLVALLCVALRALYTSFAIAHDWILGQAQDDGRANPG
jgi:hypothetical protein